MDRRHPIPSTSRRLLAVGAALLLAGAACTVDDGWRAEQRRQQLPLATEINALRQVEDCDVLVDAARPAIEQSIEWAWGSPGDDVSNNDRGSDDQMAVAESSDGGVLDSPTAQAPATTAPSVDEVSGFRSAADGDAAPDREAIGTNNQEQGVQESDLFVTDGDLMVWVVDGVLRVAQNDDQVGIDGVLDLSPRSPTELFLRNGRALVLGTTYGDVLPWTDGPVLRDQRSALDAGDAAETNQPAAQPTPETTEPETTRPETTRPEATVPETTVPGAPGPGPTTTGPTTTVIDPPPIDPVPVDPLPVDPLPIEPAPFAVATTLTLIALDDPSDPTVLATAEVEGELVSARQIDGTTRLVVRSSPMAQRWPVMAPTRAAAFETLEGVTGEDLLPRMAVDGDVDPIGGCEDVFVTGPVDTSAGATSTARPGTGSFMPDAELSTVTVLTVDENLADLSPVSLQGTADTVYASAEALYVAAGSWDQEGARTDVHRFAMPADGPVSYSGSGRVPGRLLNQFSMSELDGALRVVTTTDGNASIAGDVIEPGFPGDGPTVDMVLPTFNTEARLTVLDTDGTLDELGFVDGLGVGEEVQSVRFIGDLAYVVTFRQTDPLYALDLSDPRNPMVLGELKITGFSEYLHPVGEHLLLGVGREVDPNTGLDEGLKVSLFDVSDPTNLSEVDKFVLPGTWSEVSQTHKAFTWDAERNQAIIPVDASALVIGVDRTSLQRRGSIAHDAPWGQIAPRRSRVVDDQIWTVSDVALVRSPANSPEETSQLSY